MNKWFGVVDPASDKGYNGIAYFSINGFRISTQHVKYGLAEKHVDSVHFLYDSYIVALIFKKGCYNIFCMSSGYGQILAANRMKQMMNLTERREDNMKRNMCFHRIILNEGRYETV